MRCSFKINKISRSCNIKGNDKVIKGNKTLNKIIQLVKFKDTIFKKSYQEMLTSTGGG